jgi:hypothetical protein
VELACHQLRIMIVKLEQLTCSAQLWPRQQLQLHALHGWSASGLDGHQGGDISALYQWYNLALFLRVPEAPRRPDALTVTSPR